MASDAQLIARSLAGDGEAFVEVIRRHEAAVGAYLTRRAGCGAAEELLGEVWVAAFGSQNYDRSFPDARPWLFGVALNTLRRHWRSRRAEDPVPDVTSLAAGWHPGRRWTSGSTARPCCGPPWLISGRRSRRS